MAHSDPLPDGVTKSLALQIALITGGIPQAPVANARRGGAAPAAPAPAAPRELTESFAVWLLKEEAVTNPKQVLTKAAHETGRWHHQVIHGGQPASFARSMPLGPAPENWRVNDFFESPIAVKIDQAITWIDQNVHDDPLVRLLIAPSYHLHAFWLSKVGVDSILIADMPPSFRALQYEKLYTSEEFLLALGNEQHIIGIDFG